MGGRQVHSLPGLHNSQADGGGDEGERPAAGGLTEGGSDGQGGRLRRDAGRGANAVGRAVRRPGKRLGRV